jgi:hypothetical protein
LQHLCHCPEGHALRLVVLEWPAEHDRCKTLGLDALLDLLLNDSSSSSHADVLPRLLPMNGGQRAQISLDERLHRRQIKTSDEDECEVARIGETVLVEREGLFQIPFVYSSSGRQTPSQMILE